MGNIYNSDGSYINENNPLKVNTRNDNAKIRDSFNVIDPTLWDVVVGNGDIVTTGGNTAGSGYIKISKSIDQEDTETTFLSKFTFDSPVRLALAMSLSQRIGHQRFGFGIVGVDAQGNVVAEVPLDPVLPLASIQQTTTTLTITTQTPHGYVPGDRIQVFGVVGDSRLNYGELMVATVTSPTVITATATPSATIASVTVGPFNSTGFVQRIDPFLGANNGLGITWEGTSASNAKMISRTSKGTIYQTADTSLGTNHTNATIANAGAFADAFNPSYMYDIRYKAEGVIARTMPMDSTSGYGGMIKRTQVIPDIVSGYKLRIRARNNKSMSKPVGRILTATKSASTTATITTDVPHGLAMGDYVTLIGMRDQTNFANLTTATAVASIVNATQFTIAFGASATATTQGGIVTKINGSLYNQVAGQSIQSIQQTGGLMTVIGNTTWSGFSIGETIELRGLVDTSGIQYTQYEGVYRVANISTSTLTLVAPNLADFALINCGGAVVKRTDLRLHMFRLLDYNRQTVEIDGSIGNYSDYQEALPVNAINFSSTNTISNGQTAHDSAITGSPLRIGARGITANYTAVQTGDATDLIATLVGALIQKPYSIPELDWSFTVTTPVNVTTDQVLKSAGGAGIRNYLTGFQIKNIGTTATEYVIKDGATVIYRGYLPASMINDDDVQFVSPLKATANTALNFACITAGASVYVNAQGYQAP
jgi:hypothetical protein